MLWVVSHLNLSYRVAPFFGKWNVHHQANGVVEKGYLLANEWPIYAFDAVPMVIVLAICSYWYVGNIISESIRGQGDDFQMVDSESGRSHGRK